LNLRYLTLWLGGLALAAVLLLAAGCGDDDSPANSGSPTTVATPALTGVPGQLASVLLQPSDVPPGLDAGSPSFTTNDQLASGNPDTLAKLVAQGRQLGADVTFIPTDRLDPSSPLKGGIESAASVYTNDSGASQSYAETAAGARTNDWKANYPSVIDATVTEVQQKLGDESLWIRVSGKDCSTAANATPACTGDQHNLTVDNVIFRTGRVRGYIQATTVYPTTEAPEFFQAEVAGYVNTVIQHAQAAFPG
jgi:hypothetical protein